MFKGILVKNCNRLAPNERYHLAAQTGIPCLTAWSKSFQDDRDAYRSRFQLDAPLIAGRHFFEMVSFMLTELQQLEKEVMESIRDFGPAKSRYRYVYELFIAAWLYFTNKFGNHGCEESKRALFAWAYALRVNMLRVQFVSIDNLARSKDKDAVSPFILMRNATSGKVITNLSTKLKQPPGAGDHEKDLINFINSEKITCPPTK